MTAPLTATDEARLSTCHVDLQRIVRRVHRERMALLVVCGHRGEADQNAAFKAGTSKTPWPRSRHNSIPSQAVDVAPFPLDWKDIGRFLELGRHMQEIAAEEGVLLDSGFSWQTFKDYPHHELRRHP